MHAVYNETNKKNIKRSNLLNTKLISKSIIHYYKEKNLIN